MMRNLSLLRPVLLLAAVLFTSAAWSQRTVNGTVVDADNEPLIGATILEVGTANGTVTDFDGKFELTLMTEKPSLTFSFTGYKAQTIEVGAQTILNITLTTDAELLDEVVVVGYGSQKKVNLTGSVASLQSDRLTAVPAANVSELLAGQVPGLLTRQTSGIPGNDATTLSIRGFGDPLVLVDGIQMSLNRLDPNEIESISVLKDAAAAIYGARAGNGVILVTTKRGKSGKPSISYNGNTSWQTPTVLPQFVGSPEFAELLREGELNYQLQPTYTEEDIQKFRDGNDPNFPNQDWYDALFVDWAPMQTHNLSVRGGGDKVKYYISAGYLDQESMFTSGDWNFQRYNTRSNLDAQVTDRLSVALDLSYRRENRDEPTAGVDDVWNDLGTAQPVWPASVPDPQYGPYSGFSQRSPLAQVTQALSGFRDDRREYITGQIRLGYDILEGLKATAALNYFTNNTYRKTLNKPFDVMSYDNNTGEYTYQGTNGNNTLNERFTKYQQLYPLVSLEYDRAFGSHEFKALALAEWIDTEDLVVTADRRDLLSTDIPYLFAGSPDNIQNNGSANETGRASYVGRLNYAYKGKYLLEGTFRYDASHKFPKDSRWGFFPSISAGWRISEEPFMQSLTWLDKLKVRASYSRAGDDGVEAFRYLTGYSIREGTLATYLLENQLGRVITTTGLPNPDITWLDMTIQNVGVEMTFLNGIVGFEFDYFYRLTEGIFGTPTERYPSTFGATLPQLNINSTDDRGFDLLVTHQNKIGEFRYNIGLNYGISKRKYVEWSEEPYDDPDEQRILQREGNWYNRWIGYVSDGLFMTQEEIEAHPVDQDQNGNSTLRPGDIKYVDLNEDGVIDWRDQDEIGYGSFPQISYGMNLSASYKGFQLTALFQGASRFNQNIAGARRAAFSNWSIPYDYHYKYRWQPDPNNPGVNINPDVQLPPIDGSGTGSTANNNRTSDFWLQDNTYLRLKNINLSYSLPASVISAVGFQSASVYVAGTNLLTWSKLGIYKDSWDPERGGTGYPPIKSMTVGLNIGL